MRIDIYTSHQNISGNSLKNTNAVVIDVFRTSSTLIYAFANGLSRFLAVNDPLNAPDYAQSLNNDRILMGGAEDYQFISGFDVSDSINDYTKKKVEGKELIYYQADASPTINLGYHAKRLFLGGFINMRALASILSKHSEPIVFLCAGTHGNFSIEDGLAAGGIIDALRELNVDFELSECAYILDQFYCAHKHELFEVIKQSQAFRDLSSLGEIDDIEHALDVNKYDFAPFLYDNWMTTDLRGE